MKAHEILKDRRHAATPRSERKLAHIHAIRLDGAFERLVEAAQQLGQGGLASAVLADDGQRRTGRNGEVEAVQHQFFRCRWIGESHIRETQFLAWQALGRLLAGTKRTFRRHRFA